MNKRNTMFCLILVFILFCLPCLAQQQQQETESITITTYYPSPYGSYNELRAKKMGIGDTYYQGSVSIDPADLIVEGSVGIGMTSPGTKLALGSGQLSVPLGSVSAPSYSFSGDLNTGMWSSAADTLNLSTGGSERVRITSMGSVGIGTASPKTKLDVDDAIKVGTRSSCDADREGAIGYNSTDKVMEYCDGSGWKGFGGGCTAPFVILDAPVGERGGCEVVCNNEGHACAFTYQGGTVQPCGFWGRCVCCND